MKKLTIALAAGLVFATTAACSGGRPSADEISKTLQEPDNAVGSAVTMPKKGADCFAKAFHDSDLSDEALKAIVEKDNDYKASKADEKILTELGGTIMEKCAKAMTPTATPTTK
jgi:hypothetical protein